MEFLGDVLSSASGCLMKTLAPVNTTQTEVAIGGDCRGGWRSLTKINSQRVRGGCASSEEFLAMFYD